MSILVETLDLSNVSSNLQNQALFCGKNCEDTLIRHGGLILCLQETTVR